MLRSITFSLAIVSALAVNVRADETDSSASDKPVKAQLASYGQAYASSCTDCYSSDYSYGAGAGFAGAGQTPQAMAAGGAWGSTSADRDCSRFYHYPYVFYPQNFRNSEYYRSSDSMYYRYPPEMQIPVYNKGWHNYYPSSRRYHMGHHFILDVF